MELFGIISKRRFVIAALAVMSALMLVTAGMLTSCSGGGQAASDEAQPNESAAEEITKIGEFTSKDLDGNEVTQDVFAEADITMINFWGTFCPPCIKEMPEIQKINAEYEGKAQVIGIPIDVDFDKPESDEFKAALEILGKAKAEFRNIKPAGDIEEYAKNLYGVPTTIFVDSEGNVVGEAVLGADTNAYRDRIDGFLNK